MRFSKWHALGNTYLLVERADAGRSLDSTLVRRLCDLSTGIGADGVLEVVSADAGRADVVIWNPDGSRAELSGNGTRIAARWLARRSGAAEVTIAVGTREVHARMLEGSLVETDMGEIEVGPGETILVAGAELEFTPVRVGNPHAVIRREPDRGAVLGLGPLLEQHERFRPERTNVQLVRVEGRHDLTVGVWERGAGETPSSGTSACAAAAAAIANGWCESPVNVRLPGGVLRVALDQGRALLTGPAEEICSGEVSGDLLDDL
jgi:diaminopimelate epimerase